ncbi:hypothetical protein RDV78_05105 [Bacillota bacterium LX-D]|nr:hypothetical protein [Bacillota bacterium LX-D]
MNQYSQQISFRMNQLQNELNQIGRMVQQLAEGEQSNYRQLQQMHQHETNMSNQLQRLSQVEQHAAFQLSQIQQICQGITNEMQQLSSLANQMPASSNVVPTPGQQGIASFTTSSSTAGRSNYGTAGQFSTGISGGQIGPTAGSQYSLGNYGGQIGSLHSLGLSMSSPTAGRSDEQYSPAGRSDYGTSGQFATGSYGSQINTPISNQYSLGTYGGQMGSMHSLGLSMSSPTAGKADGQDSPTGRPDYGTGGYGYSLGSYGNQINTPLAGQSSLGTRFI